MTDPSQPQSQSSLFVTSPPAAATPAPTSTSLSTSFSQSLNLNAQPSSSDTTTSTSPSTSNTLAPTPSTYQQSTPLTPASSSSNNNTSLPTSSSFSSPSSPSPSYGIVGVRDLAASGYNLTPRFVAESSFDWLHAEMVTYVIQHTSNQTTPTDPPEVQSAARFAHAKKVYQKLDAMGFQVGVRLCERYTRDQSWFIEQLDVIKFLCKDFWIAVFRKQVDKLQTNYKGIYVLHDSSFRWLSRFSALSPEHISTTLLEDVRPYTHLACGIIRGALHNLGINANVKADIIKLPACQFTLVDVEKTEKARDTNPAASTSAAPVSAPTSARGPDSVQASPASTNRTLPNPTPTPAPAAATSTSTSASTSVLSSPPTPTPVSVPTATPASPEQSS